MSKLITDSKVLMDLITEDDNLQMTIDELKDAVLTCSELCVTIEFEDFNATRQRLAKVNMTLTNCLISFYKLLLGHRVLSWWLRSCLQCRRSGLIPVSGKSPGDRNNNPLQYSCLGNPMDRGA